MGAATVDLKLGITDKLRSCSPAYDTGIPGRCYHFLSSTQSGPQDLQNLSWGALTTFDLLSFEVSCYPNYSPGMACQSKSEASEIVEADRHCQ